jgi:pimeloyl-ACP methyl ester carboxylesterase
MATFVCIHGAGGRGSDWDLVARHLRAAGHDVVAVDLPCEQPVGLSAYADAVVEAIGERRNHVVLVAQSLAGFVAPLVCERVPVALMVLVAAMVPRPGETGGEWWDATGHEAAVAAQGLPDDSAETLFLHDVDPEVLAATEPPRHQTGTLFEEPWPLPAWPDVPTRFLVCRDDRFFPAEWLGALVRDRLGIEPDEVPGGHAAHLSRPEALADAVLRCWADTVPPAS